MALKATFTMNDVKRRLQDGIDTIEKAIIQRLMYLGERCLIECRTHHTYTDQTGNLTASMGYIVVANGRIITESPFSGGQEGSKKGEALASELALKHPTGFVLYVVAGMNYAAYVEAKGYNVLTTSEQLAERELPRMLKALTKNIKAIQI
jgi:hypothetical protein